MSRYKIVNEKTGITHIIKDKKQDAEKLAKQMTKYHNELFVVKIYKE